METVLLSGATGFLGSHLLEALLRAGYRVIILKRSTSDIRRIRHLISHVSSHDVDIEPVGVAFDQQGIDVVIHTACHYGRNGDPISKMLDINLMFGLELLEAALLHNVTTFVNTDTLLPRDLNAYAISKKQFADWIFFFRDQVQIVNVRPDHMYGPGDDASKFAPWIVGQLDSCVASIRLTPGEQRRDFVYVDDVVSAYMLILKKASELGNFSEFDIGSGKLTTIREFVEKIFAAYQVVKGESKTSLDFGALPYRSGELMQVPVDIARLSRLGWSPGVSLDVGIKNVIQDVK